MRHFTCLANDESLIYDGTTSSPTPQYWTGPKKRASFLASEDAAWQCSATSVGFRNKLQPMLSCVWLLIPDLVASLTTDNNRDAREEDDATHGSDKSKWTLDFLLTPRGSLLVIVVGEGRNDPRWLRVHDDDCLSPKEHYILQLSAVKLHLNSIQQNDDDEIRSPF